MVMPDTAIITEVLLLANGFTTGSVLAPKLTKLYQLAAIQLSQQVCCNMPRSSVEQIRCLLYLYSFTMILAYVQ